MDIIDHKEYFDRLNKLKKSSNNAKRIIEELDILKTKKDISKTYFTLLTKGTAYTKWSLNKFMDWGYIIGEFMKTKLEEIENDKTPEIENKFNETREQSLILFANETDPEKQTEIVKNFLDYESNLVKNINSNSSFRNWQTKEVLEIYYDSSRHLFEEIMKPNKRQFNLDTLKEIWKHIAAYFGIYTFKEYAETVVNFSPIRRMVTYMENGDKVLNYVEGYTDAVFDWIASVDITMAVIKNEMTK